MKAALDGAVIDTESPRPLNPKPQTLKCMKDYTSNTESPRPL